MPSTSIPKRPSGYYKKRKRKIKVTRVKIDFPVTQEVNPKALSTNSMVFEYGTVRLGNCHIGGRIVCG